MQANDKRHHRVVARLSWAAAFVSATTMAAFALADEPGKTASGDMANLSANLSTTELAKLLINRMSVVAIDFQPYRFLGHFFAHNLDGLAFCYNHDLAE